MAQTLEEAQAEYKESARVHQQYKDNTARIEGELRTSRDLQYVAEIKLLDAEKRLLELAKL